MIIGIIEGFGKSTLASYLAKKHGFEVRMTLPRKAPLPRKLVVVVPYLAGDDQRVAFVRRLTRLGGIAVAVRELTTPVPTTVTVLPNPIRLTERMTDTSSMLEREADFWIGKIVERLLAQTK
jgi:hypothetical protein